MTRYVLWLTTLCVGALLTASGCGPRFTFTPVEGTVTKNGRPLANVEVVFLADADTDTEGPRATGRTDEAGHYRLHTDHGDDGGVPGTHRVLILDLEAANKQFSQSMHVRPSKENPKRLEGERQQTVENVPRVPSIYGSIHETPLRAKVGPDPLVFDIAIP